jgi:hypothetical protein
MCLSLHLHPLRLLPMKPMERRRHTILGDYGRKLSPYGARWSNSAHRDWRLGHRRAIRRGTDSLILCARFYKVIAIVIRVHTPLFSCKDVSIVHSSSLALLSEVLTWSRCNLGKCTALHRLYRAFLTDRRLACYGVVLTANDKKPSNRFHPLLKLPWIVRVFIVYNPYTVVLLRPGSIAAEFRFFTKVSWVSGSSNSNLGRGTI